jgi:hypothetical protein
MDKNIIDTAREHLSLLCNNPARFRMSIPVQHDDSDMIFFRLIQHTEKLQSENEKLKEILTEEHGACLECVEAKLKGFTICGDCSCK